MPFVSFHAAAKSRVGKGRLRSAVVCAMLCMLLVPAPARDVVRLPVPYMRQPDGSTCLPTSLCMAMHFMGRCDLTSATIFDFHRVCRTDRYNVPDLVAKYGLYCLPSWLEHAWTPQTIQHELDCGRPVVLGVDVSRAGHFVLAVGYTDDGRVIIHDPANPHPGWPFNGAFTTTTWDRLIWRNGIMLRGEPFPAAVRAVSGNLVATTAPRTMTYGETAMAEFAIKNNGSVPWPDGVHLAAVDAYSSPTHERISPFAILPSDAGATSGTWISSSHAAAPDVKGLAPGQIALFRVPLRAPSALPGNRSGTYRENFNLVDAQGHWFDEDWLTGPSNRQIFFRVAVVPPRTAQDALPLVEKAAGGRPGLAWRLKNGGAGVLAAASNAPAFPATVAGPVLYAESSGNSSDSEETSSTDDAELASSATLPSRSVAVEVVTTPSAPISGPPAGTVALKLSPAADQDYEMAMVGDPLGTDYRVEAWVYCDLRPVPHGHGYERAGIFMHDSGQHRITSKTELENGDCLLMAYDSNDGRVHVGNFVNGGLSDYARETSTTLIKESGWHRFAMRATGPVISYELDGAQIATSRWSGRGGRRGFRRGSSGRESDPKAPLRYGDCGVFDHCLSLPQSEERHGLLFAGFNVVP